jgi:hypothetical protein
MTDVNYSHLTNASVNGGVIRNACILSDRPSGGNFLREEVRSIFDSCTYLDL